MITIGGPVKHEGVERFQDGCLLERVEEEGRKDRCRGGSAKMPYDVFGAALLPQRKSNRLGVMNT